MEKETETLDLTGYKEAIPSVNKATLTLDRDLIFVARTQRGYEVEYDPKFEWGCSSIEMVINISGKGITPKKIEKAISLSQEKYCSVHHSLRRDIKVDVKYNITPEETTP